MRPTARREARDSVAVGPCVSAERRGLPPAGGVAPPTVSVLDDHRNKEIGWERRPRRPFHPARAANAPGETIKSIRARAHRHLSHARARAPVASLSRRDFGPHTRAHTPTPLFPEGERAPHTRESPPAGGVGVWCSCSRRARVFRSTPFAIKTFASCFFTVLLFCKVLPLFAMMDCFPQRSITSPRGPTGLISHLPVEQTVKQ